MALCRVLGPYLSRRPTEAEPLERGVSTGSPESSHGRLGVSGVSQSDLASTLVAASSTEGRRLVLESVATRVTREMSDWAGRGGELSLQG